MGSSLGEEMSEQRKLFEMPGLMQAIESLDKQIIGSSYHLDHILIQGPGGIGKSFFKQKVKEYLDSDFTDYNCAILKENQVLNWTQCFFSSKDSIIFDNLHKLDPKYYPYLNDLLEKCRVIALSRNDGSKLPDDVIDRFKIKVEIPPLYQHRADILYFIAGKWPNYTLSNSALLSLLSYHWPGNYQELDTVLQRYFSERVLPAEIDCEHKLESIYSRLCEEGIAHEDLHNAVTTCFAHIIPAADLFWPLEDLSLRNLDNSLRHLKNDQSAGIELRFERFPGEKLPRITLDEFETQWAIKSFFQLVFGPQALVQDENVFDLQPLGEKSLDYIKWALQEVGKLKVGEPHPSTSYLHTSPAWFLDNDTFAFSFFTENLDQEQITAVRQFLTACQTVCQKNIDQLPNINIAGDQQGGSAREALRELAKARVRERGEDPYKKEAGWDNLKEKIGFSRTYINTLCKEVLGGKIHKKDESNEQSDVFLFAYEIEMIHMRKHLK